MSVQPAAVLRATMVADFTQFETGSKAVVRSAQGMADQVGRSGERIRQSIYGGARSFEELRAAVDPTYAAMQKYRALQQQVSGYVEAGEASQRAANIVLEQAARLYLGVETSAERAARAQREQAQAAMTAAQQAARVQEEQARTLAMLSGNYQSLRASVDPLYAASKRYESALETADAALKAKIITETEHVRVLHLAQAQMLGIAPAAGAAGAAAGKFGMVANQLGFQIQDFAVQIASGQSAFVAFAQQAPQAAGAFAMLGGRLGTVIPWIGTFIAIGAAVAPMLFNMGKEAESADQAISKLSETVARYKRYSDEAMKSSADLREQFGLAGKSAGELSQFLAEITQVEALNKAEAAMKRIAETYGGFSRQLGDMALKPGANAFTILMGGFDQNYITQFEASTAKMRQELGLTEEQARLVASALGELTDAAPGQAQIEAATALRTVFTQTFGSLAQVPPELQAIATQVGLIALSGAEVVNSLERARLAGEKKLEAATSLVAQYQQQAAMSRAIALYGSDSAAVEQLKRQEALMTAEAYIQQHQLSGLLAQRVREAALAAFDAQVNADNAATALRNAESAAKGLAAAIAAAAGFSANLDNGVVVLQAKLDALRRGANAANAATVAGLRLEAQAHRDAQIAKAEGDWAAILAAKAQYGVDIAQIETQEKLLEQIETQTEANRGATKSSNAAASASKKLTKELDREADRWLDLIDPATKYRRELEDLVQLKGRLSDGQMAAAMRQLNVQFADSLPLVGGLVDSLTTGQFTGFKGTLGSIGDMFKQWLAEMIAMAAKNQIVMAMGLGAGMSVPAAASAAGTVAQAGAAGNALSGIGMLGGLGGVGAGFQAALGLGGFRSAGIFSVTANAAAAAATGVSGLAATIGAAIPVIGIAALGIAALFGKTKLLDSGIRVTVTEMDALVETFRKTEKSRLFGLVKSRNASYALADAEIADPVRLAVGDIQGSVLDAAKVLGIGAAAFDDFRTQIEVSTKGLSEEEAARAVQEALGTLGDDFAGMIEGIDGLSQAGEGAMDTVLRLSGSLTAVQQVADTLGHSFRLAGLIGGDVASNLARAFGGLDAMAQATQAYFGVFYSEQERVETITRQTAAQLAKLGLAMPQSRDEYRRMIESLDLSQKSSAELYATLIGLSGVMDQILPTVGSLTQQLAALSGTVQTDLDRMIAATTASQTASAQAAADWYKAAGSIREYVDRLQGTAGALVSAQQALGHNAARYQQMLAAAQGGDLVAAQGLTAAAQTLLDSVRGTARNRVEMARTEARVLSDLQLMGGVADIEGARHDVVAGLLGQQVDVLTEVRDYLAGGGALSVAQIDTLNGQLGSLQSAIAAAEGISWQALQDHIAVSVDVITSAEIPEDLRQLLANATTGVTGYVDFLTRSDLPADLKWLALTGASEHIKTVDYLARNDLGAGLTQLALASTSVLQKTVDMLVGRALPEDVMRLALAGNSELSRVVNATLAANISADAMRLALGNVGAYSVSVMAALSPAIGAGVRRLVIDEQGSYAALIEAAISQSMPDAARRILLAQQGDYIANVVGVLAAGMDNSTRRLLIEANTAAVRAVTVTAAFAGTMTEDERAALIASAQSSYKTIRAAIEMAGLSPSGALFLAQIGMGDSAVQKSLIGRIALGALSADQRLLLASISEEVRRHVALRATGKASEDQLRLLAAVTGAVSRDVKLQAKGGLTEDQRAILAARDATATKTLWASGYLNPQSNGDALAILKASGWSYKSLWATGYLDPKANADALAILRARTSEITRTLKGKIDLSDLTGQQKSLLDAITGQSAGKITLGGSFVFDPSKGFSTLFEDQAKALDGLTAPMTALQASLATLRAAVVAETARAQAESNAMAIAQAQAQLASAYGIQQDALAGGQSVINAVRALEASTGGQLKNGSAAGTLGIIDGKLVYNSPNWSGPKSAESAWNSQFWNAGGLEDQIFAARGQINQASAALEAARNAVRAAGGIPAFASGGFHAGGLRFVGEQGVELEATGPSRIYNASQTRNLLQGGNEEHFLALIAEIRALRQENAALREEQRQLGLQTVKHTQQTARQLREWGATSVPTTTALVATEW